MFNCHSSGAPEASQLGLRRRLLAMLLYWPCLMSWFQKDDFAWLNLRNLVHNWNDLRWALFAPVCSAPFELERECVLPVLLLSVRRESAAYPSTGPFTPSMKESLTGRC